MRNHRFTRLIALTVLVCYGASLNAYSDENVYFESSSLSDSVSKLELFVNETSMTRTRDGTTYLYVPRIVGCENRTLLIREIYTATTTFKGGIKKFTVNTRIPLEKTNYICVTVLPRNEDSDCYVIYGNPPSHPKVITRSSAHSPYQEDNASLASSGIFFSDRAVAAHVSGALKDAMRFAASETVSAPPSDTSVKQVPTRTQPQVVAPKPAMTADRASKLIGQGMFMSQVKEILGAPSTTTAPYPGVTVWVYKFGDAPLNLAFRYEYVSGHPEINNQAYLLELWNEQGWTF